MGLFGAFRVAGVAVCLLVSALRSTALGPDGFEPAQQGLLIVNATRLALPAGSITTPGTVDECALACIRSTGCLSFNIRASATGSAMAPGPQCELNGGSDTYTHAKAGVDDAYFHRLIPRDDSAGKRNYSRIYYLNPLILRPSTLSLIAQCKHSAVI